MSFHFGVPAMAATETPTPIAKLMAWVGASLLWSSNSMSKDAWKWRSHQTK